MKVEFEKIKLKSPSQEQLEIIEKYFKDFELEPVYWTGYNVSLEELTMKDIES